jgi:DNA-binding NtrC family response regulator
MTGRVLIADGDTSLRQRVSAALLDADVFADTSANAPETLSRLVSDSYSVIIVDVALSGDVEQVVARVAAIPEGTRPVVLLLGSPEAARSLDVEIVQIVLRKPVNLRQLVDIVKSCIRNASERGDAAASKRKSDHATS